MKISQSIQSANHWLFNDYGSTRPLALFRIMLILLLWSRFAAELTLWNAQNLSYIFLGMAFFILTGLGLIGWQTRRVMILLAGTLAVMYFTFGKSWGHTAWTHHHVYLLFICSFLCAIGPSGYSLSMDRLIALRNGNVIDETGPLTANKLILLQLAAVYFWAAFDKTNADFLTGIRLDQILHFHYDATFLAESMLLKPAITTLAVSVVVAEYFLSIAIIFRRFIALIFLLGFVIHIAFYYVLPVGTFSLTMMAMYIFLIKPETIHQLTDNLLLNCETKAKADNS